MFQMKSFPILLLGGFLLGVLADEIDDFYDRDNKEMNNQPNVTIEDRKLMTPGQQASIDSNNKKIIEEFTTDFTKAMAMREQIVVAGYNIEDYRPAHGHWDGFWENTINPLIIQSLVQDIKGRIMITKAFSTITDLAIIIEKGLEILQEAHGSQKAIDIVLKNIPEALNELTRLVDKIDELNTGAIEDFANQTTTIFSIIGPNAADFVKQKEEQEDIITREYLRRQGFITDLAYKQANVTRLQQLINVTISSKGNRTNDIEKSKEINDRLNSLTSTIHDEMNNIPDKISQLVTVREGWWIFKHDETYNEMVNNPHKEEDRAYYQKMIDANNAEIRQREKTEEAQQKIIEKLDKQLSEYYGQLNASMGILKSTAETLNHNVKDADSEIDQALGSIRNISANQNDVEQQIGLKGKVLVDCVINVRQYAKKLGSEPAFEPLTSIIKVLISLVKSDVEWLTSEPTNRVSVYRAASHLGNAVKFISDYAVEGGKALNEISDEYRKIINNNKVQKYLALEGVTFKA